MRPRGGVRARRGQRPGRRARLRRSRKDRRNEPTSSSSGTKLPATSSPSAGHTSHFENEPKSASRTIPVLSSQGASTPYAIPPPRSTLAPPRGPIIAPIDASSGLQLIPIVRLASAKPAMVPPNAAACGMTFGASRRRNQVIAKATAAVAAEQQGAPHRRLARRVDGLNHLARGAAGRKRQRVVDDQLPPQDDGGDDAQHAGREAPEHDRPRRAASCRRNPGPGRAPASPSTKPMMAADDAVVCVMLFSRTPKGPPPKRRAPEKIMKASSAAGMLMPSMKPVFSAGVDVARRQQSAQAAAGDERAHRRFAPDGRGGRGLGRRHPDRQLIDRSCQNVTLRVAGDRGPGPGSPAEDGGADDPASWGTPSS